LSLAIYKWYLPFHNAIMNTTLTLDKAGRIVLPKPLRDELQLAPGDVLEIESTGEEITLRPLRGNGALRKKHGIWVFRADEPLTHAAVERVRKNVRGEREAGSLGKYKRR
jgi:AbrB family looped-hinge helix DNA binding protein